MKKLKTEITCCNECPFLLLLSTYEPLENDFNILKLLRYDYECRLTGDTATSDFFDVERIMKSCPLEDV